MKTILILMTAVSLFMTGCASLSSYQEAKTIDKGTNRVFLGAGTYNEQYKKQDNEIAEEVATIVEDINWILLEGGMRIGLLDNVDVGIKLTFPGGLSVDGKYMLLGGEGELLAASVGAEFGYMSIEMTSTNSEGAETSVKSTTMDFSVPAYLSIYPTDWLGLTVIPDYTFRTMSPASGPSSSASIYGANASLKIGSSWGLIAEYGYHLSTESQVEAIKQVGAVLFFNGTPGFLGVLR